MCSSPTMAINLGVNPSTGKRMIKLYRDSSKGLDWLRYAYGAENVLLLPCGHCSECQLKRRAEWSVRCACEALDHQENCFVTLTYDDEHYPSNDKIWKKDNIKFIKAIRNSGFKVRYFGSGELGSKTFRRHSHLILFGFMPHDLIFESTSRCNEAMYSSKFLTDIWKKGAVIVQFFSPRTAGYVAGYVSKKLGNDEGFQIQSTDPGIGYNFIIKNKHIALEYGAIFGDFGLKNSSGLPRYFKKVLEQQGFQLPLDLITEEKMKSASTDMYAKIRRFSIPSIDQAYSFGAYFADKKIKKLERSM